MNLILKSAVGAALGLAAVGANALGVPASNSSDLVLVIQNVNTPANVYNLDTQISITSALGTGTVGSNSVLDSTTFSGIDASIAASSTLQAFLAANPAAGDGWTLEAAQYSGLTTNANPTNAASKNAGKAYGIFASGQVGGAYSSNQLATFQNYLGGVQNDYVAPPDNLGLSGLNGHTEATGTTVGTGASFSVAATGHYGMFSGPDLTTLGSTAVTLYAFTGNGSTGAIQSFILGTAAVDTLGDLVLTSNGVTAVPLPPAVWLFGSGLLGLVGVSRRRKTAV